MHNPFVLEAAAALPALSRPNHIGQLCSWGLVYLSPRCNFNYFGKKACCLSLAILAALSTTVSAEENPASEQAVERILVQGDFRQQQLQ